MFQKIIKIIYRYFIFYIMPFIIFNFYLFLILGVSIAIWDISRILFFFYLPIGIAGASKLYEKVVNKYFLFCEQKAKKMYEEKLEKLQKAGKVITKSTLLIKGVPYPYEK